MRMKGGTPIYHPHTHTGDQMQSMGPHSHSGGPPPGNMDPNFDAPGSGGFSMTGRAPIIQAGQADPLPRGPIISAGAATSMPSGFENFKGGYGLVGGKRRKTKKVKKSKKGKKTKKTKKSKKSRKVKKSKKSKKTKKRKSTKNMPKLAKALRDAIRKMGGNPMEP